VTASAVALRKDAGWLSADLAVDTRTVGCAVTAVLARQPGGGWALVAAQVSEPRANREVMMLAGAAAFDELPELPADAASSEELEVVFRDDLARFAGLARKVPDLPQAAVFGSDAGERAFGAAAARRLLASWRSLAFTVEDPVLGGVAGDVGWVAADVTATFGPRRKKVSVPFRAFLVYQRRGGRWLPVAAHFALGAF
jgi:hypothetical protein